MGKDAHLVEYIMSLIIKFLLTLCFISFSVLADGGIFLDATRIIYSESDRARAVKVYNSSKEQPYLIRSWVSLKSEGQANGWVVTPPVYRLNVGEAIQLKINKTTAESLPDDRESIFFLNVLGIPGVVKDKGDSRETDLSGKITIAINTRIKVLYRPQQIAEQSSSKAFEQLTIKNVRDKLVIDNPTPFHVNFSTFKANGVVIKMKNSMVAPFSQEEVTIPTKATSVSYSIINDFGGEMFFNKKIM